MNKKFQEYKKCEVEFVDHLDLGFSVRGFTFSIEPDKDLKKEKYNRAKEKRDFERRVKEDLER